MISNFVVYSPPVGAFIDYIMLLIIKSITNSLNEFYDLLFISKTLKEVSENRYEELHNLDKDSISGREMK